MELQKTGGDCVLTWALQGQAAVGTHRVVCLWARKAGGGRQENLISWSEQVAEGIKLSWFLQKAHSKLPECGQEAASRPRCGSQCRLSLPFVMPGAAQGCSFHQPQLPEQIYTHIIVIIDNYHHYRVVTEMCWILGQTLMLVSQQRGSSAVQHFDVTFRYPEMIRHYKEHIKSWP